MCREGVILFRKAALVIIAVFIRDDFFQVFLSIVLVILCLMLQIVVHPFGTAVITTGSLSASRASLPVQGPMAYLQPQESKPSAVQTASDDVVVQSNRNTFTIVSKAGSTESLVVTHRSSDDLNFLETLSLIATLVTMLGCTW